MKIYDTSVYIGRFQPLHSGHLHVMKHAITLSKRCVFLVGSANAAPSPRNPFNYHGRRKIIVDSLSDRMYNCDVFVKPLTDFPNDEDWVSSVRATVESLTDSHDITLIGHVKEDTKFYLSMFPFWSFHNLVTPYQRTATDIREDYFSGREFSTGIAASDEYLNEFKQTPEYTKLKRKWLAERTLQGAREALVIAKGEADPATFKVYYPFETK